MAPKARKADKRIHEDAPEDAVDARDISQLAESLRREPDRDSLVLNFSRQATQMGITDTLIEEFSEALPPKLKTLKLSFAKCHELTDEGLCSFAMSLPFTLISLQLNLSGCRNLTDESLCSLVQNCPRNLKEFCVVFDFRGNDVPGLTDKSIEDVASGLPGCLTKLYLRTAGSKGITATSCGSLTRGFARMPRLKAVNVSLCGESLKYADLAPMAEALESFPSSLQDSEVEVGNGVTDPTRVILRQSAKVKESRPNTFSRFKNFQLDKAAQGEFAQGLSQVEDVARQKLIKVFQECDLDGNGSLSVGELFSVFREIQPGISFSAVLQMFIAADANVDGAVDTTEFVNWVLGMKK